MIFIQLIKVEQFLVPILSLFVSLNLYLIFPQFFPLFSLFAFCSHLFSLVQFSLFLLRLSSNTHSFRTL